MVKKLLWYNYGILFFLSFWTAVAFAECPTSVSISASPADNFCENSAITFVATPTGGTGAFIFQWELNGSVVGSNSNQYVLSTPTQGDQVKVSVISANGVTCSITKTFPTLSVNTIKTPTVSVTVNDNSVCLTDNVTFTATNTNGGSNPIYAWYINGSTTAEQTGTSAIFSTTGFNEGNNTVTVEMTSSLPCVTNQTVSKESAVVNVIPDATITSPSNADQTNCINTSIGNISFTIGGGATGATVSGLPAGVSGALSGKIFTISGTPTVDGDFPYTVSTTGNCKQTSTTGTLTINADTSISLSSGNNTQTVCASQAIAPIVYHLGANSTGATISGLPNTFSGSYSGGQFTITGSSATAGTHNFTVTAEGPCDGAALTGTIIIEENLTPSVIIDSDVDVICQGATVTFTATPTNGGATPTYQWKIDGANAGTDSNIFSTNTLTNGQQVSVVLDSSEECLMEDNVASNAIAITVNDNLTPTVSISSDKGNTICEGTSVIFTATPVNGGAAPTYQWMINGSPVNGAISSTFTKADLQDAQQVSVVMTSNETCLTAPTATSEPIGMTVNPNLTPTVSISSNDPDNIICSGTAVTFTAQAVHPGTSPSFAWKINGSIVQTGTGTFQTSSLNNGDKVSVSLTSNETCLATTTAESNEVTVQVDSPISTVTPVFDATITSHNPTAICPVAPGLVYTVQAIPGATSYNWTLPTGFTITNGANSNSITVTATTTAKTGTVTVRGKNACSGTTQVASLNVTVGTFTFADAGTDRTVCKGTTSVTLAGKVGGAISNHQDYYWVDGGAGGSFSNPGGNELGSIYTIPGTVRDNGGTVTITLTTKDPEGDCPQAVDSMTITVLKNATITPTGDLTQEKCINTAIEEVSFAIDGAGTNASATGLPTGVTGVFANGVFTLSGTPSVAGIFNYTVNTTGACTSQQTSINGTIEVYPEPTVADLSPIISCAGSSTQAIVFSGSVTGTTYSWTNSNTAIGLADAGTGDIASFVGANTTNSPITADITVTPTANGCVGVAKTFQITVNPTATFTDPTDVEVCNQETISAILFGGASVEETSFSWVNDNTAIGLAESGKGDIAAFTASNTTNSILVANITVTPTANGCDGTPQSFTITVNPTAGVTKPIDLVICNGEAVPSVVFSGSSIPDTTYEWTNDNSTVGLAAGGAGDLPGFNATNASNEPVIANITVTPMVKGCAGTSQTFSITVNPTPTVSVPEPIVVCHGESVSEIIFSGAVDGTTFAWTNSDTSIGLAEGGDGNISSFAATNETATPVTATISVTPTANECEVTAVTFEITVNPSPTVNVGEDQTVCSDGGTEITAELGGGATSGIWTSSGSGTFADPNAVSTIYTPGTSDITNGTVTLSFTTEDPAGPCGAAVDSKILTINEAVVITSEPLNISVCSTERASFEVIATGDILSYEWFLNGVAIQNSNAAKLVIDQATSADAGTYTVEITGEDSCNSITSTPAILSVDENIVISGFTGDIPAGQTETGQPKGGSYCTGSVITLSVNASANGADLQYQWMDPNNQIVGDNSPELVLTNAQPNQSGDYYVVITGPESFTCETATSAKASISVGSPPIIVAIGDDLDLCSNHTVNITTGVEVTNAVSALWTVPEGKGSITEATSLSAAVFTPAAGITGPVVLTLTVYGEEGCSESIDTAEKTINIIPLPVISAFSYSAEEFCVTDTVEKIPTLTGENLDGGTFEVQPAEGLNISANGIIQPNLSTPGTYTIIYKPLTVSPCASVESEPVTVVIGTQPIADFEYDATIYCKDTQTPENNIVPEIYMLNGGAPGNFTFTGEGTLALDPATGNIDLSNSDPGSYIITNTLDYTGEEEDGCTVATASFNLSINAKPVPAFSFAASAYCSDSANPAPEITGTTGGVFSSTEGLVFVDTKTGGIDLAASTPGTYTITYTLDIADDACEEVSATADVTINKKAEATFSYSKVAYCFSEGIANITYPEGYQNEVTFSNEALAAFLDEDTGAITWTAEDASVIVGSHSIAYTITGFEGCADITGTLPLVIDAVPVGGELAFEGNGRIFMTCEYAVPGYAAPLTLTGFQGEIVNWEYHNEFTTTWTPYDSQSPTLTTSEVESLVANISTVFRVKVKNGACEGGVYSATAVVSVIPTDIEPTPVTVAPNVLCYGNQVTLTSETGYGDSFGEFEGGAFDNAGIKNNGWSFTNLKGGSNDFTSGANNGRADHWLRMNPHGSDPPNEKVYTANLDNPTTGTMVNWDTSFSPEGNKGFAIVTGDNDSYMETPVFSLEGMDVAILTFDQAYNITEGTWLRVEISTDGGNTYESEPLFEMFGTATSGNYDNFGDKTPEERPLNKMEIDLGKYFGYTNLRIRFNYIGSIDGDVWAVDAIKVPDGAQGAQLIWYYDDDRSDPDNQLDTIGQVNQYVVNYTPQKIGWNDFEVRTAILLDSNGDACETLEHAKTRRVFVFDQYTTNVNFEVGSCGNTSAQLTSFVTGAFQGEQDPSAITLDGYRGKWNIVALSGTDYILKNPDGSLEPDPLYNPNAILESENLGDFEVSWVLEQTIYYPEDYYVVELQGQLIVNDSCPPVVTSETVTLQHCTTLDFDGVDDYIDLGTGYTDGSYSIEAWIRPFAREKEDGTFTDPTTGTIISGPSFEISMADFSGIVATGDRWYHIALNPNGDLYIDGILAHNIGTGSGVGPETYIGARWDTTTGKLNNYFSGWIEEVRIWNAPLSQDEIRFMMNQRIKLVGTPASTTPVDGEVVPVKDVGSYKVDADGYNEWEEVEGDDLENDKVWYKRNWGNLVGYYRLISADPDPIIGYLSFDASQKPAGGMTPNFANPANPGRLHNMETHQQNTSPTPYISYLDAATDSSLPWTEKNTWLRPEVWDYPNSTSNGSSILWNIARVRDNIHSGPYDIWMLGLSVESGELEIQNSTAASPHWADPGQMLRVTHYLNLQGIIDLNGESQLLQNSGSIIDPGSKGRIEIDQQGTASSFNYNYWTSPVSIAFGHLDYSIKAVMKDGTTPVPVDLDFGSTYFYADGPPSDPAKVSTYWLWKHHGDTYYYAQWHYVGETGAVGVGEGYSMKGTDGYSAIKDRQNYTFKGMPNNGEVSLPLGANQGYLTGNPFPSALDARQFILDHLDKNLVSGATNDKNVFNGTLLFWSHFAGHSHELEQYVGGYAPYNLSGGTAPYATDDRIDNSDPDFYDDFTSGELTPGDFIPIGQAFVMNTKIDSTVTIGGEIVGGPILFKNSQRSYERELDGESVFLSQERLSKSDKKSIENRQKIYLNYKSPEGYLRQLLITADPLTTNNFDIGYDAPLIENNKEDMYWIFENSNFIIQGVPHFNDDQEFKLGVKVGKEDKFIISIDNLKNIPEDKPIYLKDSLLNIYHNLKKGPYEATATVGTNNDRFKIVFRLQENPDPDEEADLPEEDEVAEGNDDIETLTGIELMYLTNSREILIRNPKLVGIQGMVLNNLLGQKVHEFFELPLQEEVYLPVKHLSSGVYVVKLKTDKGIFTEKIILDE